MGQVSMGEKRVVTNGAPYKRKRKKGIEKKWECE